MEPWQIIAPLGSTAVAALTLTHQIRKSSHPMNAAHERAANALGLAKSLSELEIPVQDAAAGRKRKSLQDSLLEQSFLATQQYLHQAAPVLTNHRQTLLVGIMAPASLVLLSFNVAAAEEGSAAYALGLLASAVVPLVFGIATNIVYDRVDRYKETVKSLKGAAEAMEPESVQRQRQRTSRLSVRASRRLGTSSGASRSYSDA